MMNFAVRSAEQVSKNDEFLVQNKEFCIKNEEFCVQNDELCSRATQISRQVDTIFSNSIEVSYTHAMQMQSTVARDGCKIHRF